MSRRDPAATRMGRGPVRRAGFDYAGAGCGLTFIPLTGWRRWKTKTLLKINPQFAPRLESPLRRIVLR